MKFTAETARIAALNSHKPTSARYVHPVEVDTEAQAADVFRRTRLARVRAQLDKLDQMIASEEDPQKIDRIASAQARLSEQERQLSNRSMPPVLRAPQIVTKRRSEPITEPVPSTQSCASDTPSGSVPVQPADPPTPQSE